ncbi:MAG: WYL domain-containing protein [Candidatus Bathyarchaeia archaeon]
MLLGLDVDRGLVDTLIERVGGELSDEDLKRIEYEVDALVEEAEEFDLDYEPYHDDYDFLSAPSYPYSETLKLLEEAIEEGKLAEIQYYTASTGEFRIRTVEPKSIERRSGIPYLNAFCYLRMDDRVFRLSRIKEIKLVEEEDEDNIGPNWI